MRASFCDASVPSCASSDTCERAVPDSEEHDPTFHISYLALSKVPEQEDAGEKATLRCAVRGAEQARAGTAGELEMPAWDWENNRQQNKMKSCAKVKFNKFWTIPPQVQATVNHRGGELENGQPHSMLTLWLEKITQEDAEVSICAVGLPGPVGPHRLVLTSRVLPLDLCQPAPVQGPPDGASAGASVMAGHRLHGVPAGPVPLVGHGCELVLLQARRACDARGARSPAEREGGDAQHKPGELRLLHSGNIPPLSLALAALRRLRASAVHPRVLTRELPGSGGVGLPGARRGCDVVWRDLHQAGRHLHLPRRQQQQHHRLHRRNPAPGN